MQLVLLAGRRQDGAQRRAGREGERAGDQWLLLEEIS